MAKKNIKLSASEIIRRDKENTARVYAALRNGYTTKKDIAEVCDITLYMLGKLFEVDIDLHAEYVIKARELSDIANANFARIIKDRTHPNNYAATIKHMDKRVTEFDTIFETKDENKLNISLGFGDNIAPPEFTFLVEKESEENDKDD